MSTEVGQVGEKRLLRDIVLPLVNPASELHLAGDDCAVLEVPDGHSICASTDRVPWNLTAYKLGIMDEYGLGYYLAVLNISDLAAMGATPSGMLLNIALPADFRIAKLLDIFNGILAASEKYHCPILGGDFSDAAEPSISATSMGLTSRGKALFRRGARAGDTIYTTGPCGLAAAALRYFQEARPRGMTLSDEDQRTLRDAWLLPVPQLASAQALLAQGGRATAMDNTDGMSETIFELADINRLHYSINVELVPLHPITRRVAEFLGEDPIYLAMGAGADFNLIGTTDGPDTLSAIKMHPIGTVENGAGGSTVDRGVRQPLEPHGWNYYLKDRS